MKRHWSFWLLWAWIAIGYIGVIAMVVVLA